MLKIDWSAEMSGVTPADIPTPHFDNLLASVCGRDEAVVIWMWHYLGYLAIGKPTHRRLLVIQGPPGNGKAELCRVIQKVVGAYAVEADPALVHGRKHGGYSLLDLRGKRFWFIPDLDAKSWDEDKLKALTSGRRIQAKKSASAYLYFEPEGGFVIATDRMPKLNKIDDGTKELFFVILSAFKPDMTNLDEQLAIIEDREMPGILFKILSHAEQVYSAGLDLPPTPIAITSTTQRYITSQDDFYAWYVMEAEASDPHKIIGLDIKVLKKRFDDYWKRKGRRPPMKINEFAQRLKRNGCVVTSHYDEKGQRSVDVRGIRLRPNGFS